MPVNGSSPLSSSVSTSFDSFPSSSAPHSVTTAEFGDIIKRGYIRLQIPDEYSCSCFRSNGGWKRKYLLLRDGSLFIFAVADALIPQICVPLYGAACIVIHHPKSSQEIAAEVITPQHNLYIVAALSDALQDSQSASDLAKETRQWSLAIQRACILASGGIVPAHFLSPASSTKSSSRPPSPSASPQCTNRKSAHTLPADDYKGLSYQLDSADGHASSSFPASSASSSSSSAVHASPGKVAYVASSRSANVKREGPNASSSNDPNEPLLSKKALFQ